MKYTTEKNNAELLIKFTANAEEWNEFINAAYERNKGKYNVNGFRKGHVPRKVLENNYGKGLFFEDALYGAAQEYYREFLDKNNDMEFVSRPEIDESSVAEEDGGISFAVKVVLRPEVKLGLYKGLEIKKSKVEAVKNEEIDERLKELQMRNARILEVTEGTVADGDEINLDYAGSVDNVAFEGGTATGQTLTVGSHTFIDGFEEQLIGMNVGDEKNIEVTFPEDYHAEELKGKAAAFYVKINSVSRKELPEIDDEFAKDVSEFDTLKSFKADIKRQLKEQKEKAAAYEDEDTLIETVVKNAEVEIPEVMVEERIDDYIQDFKYKLMYRGLDIDNYYKYTNSSEKQLREEHRERALKSVRARLVLEAIAFEEKITADESKIAEYIKEYAEKHDKDADEYAKNITEDEKNHFEAIAIGDSLIEYLKKVNTIV